MKKLRLLLFEKCDRSCTGCCNNDWDLQSLPVEKDFSQYDIIMLTGGEPMLEPQIVINTIRTIKKTSNAVIYMYTAKCTHLIDLYNVLSYLDGLTLTLHHQDDVAPFEIFNSKLSKFCLSPLFSFRLNVFKGIDISHIDISAWKVKDNIKWIKNLHLPTNETFKRL